LFVHISALNNLNSTLRVYEGCASRTFGQLEQTTIIKFRADKPKVSRRKETFVDKTYPHYNKFAKLTVQEKKFGLLDNSISIEAQKNWQQRLTDENVEIKGH